MWAGLFVDGPVLWPAFSLSVFFLVFSLQSTLLYLQVVPRYEYTETLSGPSQQEEQPLDEKHLSPSVQPQTTFALTRVPLLDVPSLVFGESFRFRFAHI